MIIALKKYFLCLLTIAILSVNASAEKLMDIMPSPTPLPSMSFDDGNQSAGIEKFLGHYVLVNFWATWCVPCIKEMPALDRLAESLYKQGLIIIAINQDAGGFNEVKPFLKSMALKKILVWYDKKNKGFRDLGFKGLPTTILINPEGFMVAKLEGSAEWDQGLLVEQIKNIAARGVQ
ncbi:MAG: thiol-disulfide isomerase/thioredoxin [Porticoccus sp.]|jgi:thiol-disulfide isomerase/thioredoxin